MLLLSVNPRKCDEIKLEYGIYICAAVHLLTFLLLLASYMCPSTVVKLGRCMVMFYFMIVGSMGVVQVIFFSGESCNRVSPLLYYWLFTNILLFYIIVAYGLSLWGAYICWEVDEEERLIEAALGTQLVRNFGDPEYMEKLRIAGWGPQEIEMQKKLLAIQAAQAAVSNRNAVASMGDAGQ